MEGEAPVVSVEETPACCLGGSSKPREHIPLLQERLKESGHLGLDPEMKKMRDEALVPG